MCIVCKSRPGQNVSDSNIQRSRERTAGQPGGVQDVLLIMSKRLLIELVYWK